MSEDADTLYVPASGPNWARVSPRQAGFNPDLLQAAVDRATEIETHWTHKLERRQCQSKILNT